MIGEVTQLFGPERVFSPTALEEYVACPFRFFLRHVLRLEPLEDPSEEIEVTRRGQAFHRALARLHRKLKDDGVHAPTDAVTAEMTREMADAVDEDVRPGAEPGGQGTVAAGGPTAAQAGGKVRRSVAEVRQAVAGAERRAAAGPV